MEFLHQIKKKFLRIFKYSIIYFFTALCIVLVYGSIYCGLGIENPYRISEDVFWAINMNIPEKIRYWGISEIVIKNIFFIVWVGSFLSRFLSPLNPIFFSKYITYQNEQMEFRYWIMYPAHKFLYNIQIRIFLSDGFLYNGGENKIKADWELDIASARGVRSVVIENNNAFFSEIESAGEKRLTIMIHGNDQNGVVFRGQHSYKIKDSVKCGYKFVSIRQPECLRLVKDAFAKDEIFPYKMDKKLVRYQNFHKIYKPLPRGCGQAKLDKREDTENTASVDIFSYRQIAEGEYTNGLRQKILDMVNRIISRYLDKNGENDFPDDFLDD